MPKDLMERGIYFHQPIRRVKGETALHCVLPCAISYKLQHFDIPFTHIKYSPKFLPSSYIVCHGRHLLIH